MIAGVLMMGHVRDGVSPRDSHRAGVADRTGGIGGMAGMAAVRTAAQAMVAGTGNTFLGIGIRNQRRIVHTVALACS